MSNDYTDLDFETDEFVLEMELTIEGDKTHFFTIQNEEKEVAWSLPLPMRQKLDGRMKLRLEISKVEAD